MNLKHLFVACGMLLLVGGCATLPPNPLSRDTIASLKITEIKVEIAPEAPISWPDYSFEIAFSESAAAPSLDPSTPAPPSLTEQQLNARVRAAVKERMMSVVRATLPAMPSAKRPARIVVTIEGVNIPSVIQRVVLGGNPILRAQAAVVDAKTGAVLAAYPASSSQGIAGQGVGGTLLDRAISGQTGLFDRVAHNWSTVFSRWMYESP
jgi:hypothetical protein